MFNNEKTSKIKNHLSKRKRVLYPYIPVKNTKKKEESNEEEEADGRILTFSADAFTNTNIFLNSYSNSFVERGNRFEQLNRTINYIMVNTKTTKPLTKKVKTNIKVSAHKYNGRYDFQINFPAINDYNTYIDIVGYPTGNCQLSSLGIAKNILLVQDSFKEELINTIKAKVSQQFIVDINVMYEKRIERFFEDYTDIVIKTPYISTNDNSMILYILKWKKEHKSEGMPFF